MRVMDLVWVAAVLVAGFAGYFLAASEPPAAIAAAEQSPEQDLMSSSTGETGEGFDESPQQSPAVAPNLTATRDPENPSVQEVDTHSTDDKAIRSVSREKILEAFAAEDRPNPNEFDVRLATDMTEEIRSKTKEFYREAELTIDKMEWLGVHRYLKWEAEEAAAREDAARGGIMGLLDSLEENPVHRHDLLDDIETFASYFERKSAGPGIDGATWTSKQGLPDGSALMYPPGVHEWRSQSLDREKFPRDLLIRGAGMDVTLVRLDEVHTRDTVHSLTFRDLTLDCGNKYLTDLRRSSITLRLERCRVIRFDMGAGASVMLSAPSAAFYATDCIFEAGFGRSPDSGSLFRVRNSLLARLDHCRIVGPFDSVYDADDSATYLFQNCSFENQAPRQRRDLESPPYGVRFVNCSFSFSQDDAWDEKPKLLSELNEDW